MMFKNLFLMGLVFSGSVLADDVSFEEKQNRVEYLEELQKQYPQMDIDVYRRELQYEKLNLTKEERARAEAFRIVEQIKTQIINSYELAIKTMSPSDALLEIKQSIERDGVLLEDKIADAIKEISFKILDDIYAGKISGDENIQILEDALMKGVEERVSFLNEEGDEFFLVSELSSDPGKKKIGPDTKNYEKKSDLLRNLVADKDNPLFINGSAVSHESSIVTKHDLNISLQVTAEYLGVSLSVGPRFNFSREYATNFIISAEGGTPALKADGTFDYFKRDRAGQIISVNGIAQRRLIQFSCNSTLNFSTQAEAGGGFSVQGVGVGASVSKSIKQNVKLGSSKVALPETIEGKAVNYAMLSDICHQQFINTKITNTITVKQSLNLMMRNMVSSLRYTHPKTRCSRDQQCQNWFNQEVMAFSRRGNVPRCVETSEKFFTCELRGQAGQNCTVFEGGRRTSDGMGEFKCDKGLSCVKFQSAGWFRNWSLYQYAKGSCQAVKSKVN
jgi:uncharacterized protein YciU (UPF0263 family)